MNIVTFMNIGHFLQSNILLKCGITICLLTTLYACQPSTVYYSYEAIPTEGWRKCDTLSFILPNTLAPSTYHMEVGIRHSGKYPYRDVWLELTHYIPSETELHEWKEQKDTIHIYLANKKGNWKSTGTTGGHYQLLSESGLLTVYPEFPQEEQSTNHLIDQQKTSETNNHTQKTVKTFVHAKEKKYTFQGQQHKIGKQNRLQVKLVQIMTDSLLQNISDVGIRLSKE